jgi:hypothetical protein
MNQNIFSKLCIGLLVLLSALGAFAQDHKPLPFSADSTLTKTGQEIMTGKLYMAWPKVRLDTKDVQSGFTAFVIIDYVAQKAISGVPQYQTYMELSLNQQNQTAKSTLPIGPNFDASQPCAHTKWSCKKLEPQAIAGRSCDVWEIVTDEHGTLTVWMDTKLSFPIKTKSADGYIQEYTNIHEGQPPPSLFEGPHGYRKAEAPAKTSSD